MVDRGIATGLEWSDLAVVLAICRAESLFGAAKLLGCSHTTVYRRINAIEDRAGVRFFERLPTGYAMTDAGEVAMRYAERIEGEVLALSREVLGRDTKLQGKVVVTAPDGVISDFLPPLLAEFHHQHPDVTFELHQGSAALDLARREADVAIRATLKPPDESLGRRICQFRFAPYASPSYLEAHGAKPLSEHRYVTLGDSIGWLVPHLWKTVARAEEQLVLRTNSGNAAMAAARAGLGVTVMPCYRADPYEGLHRMAPPFEHLTLELWVLTHPALRHTARVKILMSFLADALKEHAPLFDGSSVEG